MGLFAIVTTVVFLSFAFVAVLASIIDNINENLEKEGSRR
jgi:hypothetical protein